MNVWKRAFFKGCMYLITSKGLPFEVKTRVLVSWKLARHLSGKEFAILQRFNILCNSPAILKPAADSQIYIWAFGKAVQ